MGGGSSDAACALTTLNQLWRIGLPDARLYELAAQLGSDVPFFIAGGTARIYGRGEVVVPLPDAEPNWLVIAKPPVSISTADVFRRLAPEDYGSATDTDALEEAIRKGQPLPLARLVNTLEVPVLDAYPAVRETCSALLESGASVVRLSGSGPTLFAPFRRLRDAAPVFERARTRGVTAWLTHSVGRANFRGAFP
jgi:4-diphosphocytidyl-2-C-methyl-D-erythritol kinase